MSKSHLDPVFFPRSVAIAGVTSNSTSWNVGRALVGTLHSFGFKGKVYPLNPKGGEVEGIRIHARLEDVDGPVDHLMSFIPAPLVPQLVKDCVAKGVKVISLYSAGFSEMGTEEAKRLETEICRLACAGGVRVLGPNCMGVYCPKGVLTFAPGFPSESGKVAIICQSGGNTAYLVRAAARRGVRFSKVVSYGNACDIDESELLEYLASDAETGVVAAYIEGVKDGRRFQLALERVASKKPVIILKGGHTEAGAGVVASHTGALAGSDMVWDSLLRQSGAVRVDSLDELIDMMVTFLYMPLTQGRRAVIFGFGGGASVLAADECAAAGLSVPALPPEIQEELGNLTNTRAGTILSNPIDLVGEGRYEILRRLSHYDGIDLLAVQIPLGNYIYGRPGIVHYSSLDTILRLRSEESKPMAVVVHWLVTDENWQLALEYERRCSEAGLPVYHSITGMAKAIDRFLRYHENRPR